MLLTGNLRLDAPAAVARARAEMKTRHERRRLFDDRLLAAVREGEHRGWRERGVPSLWQGCRRPVGPCFRSAPIHQVLSDSVTSHVREEPGQAARFKPPSNANSSMILLYVFDGPHLSAAPLGEDHRAAAEVIPAITTWSDRTFNCRMHGMGAARATVASPAVRRRDVSIKMEVPTVCC